MLLCVCLVLFDPSVDPRVLRLLILAFILAALLFFLGLSVSAYHVTKMRLLSVAAAALSWAFLVWFLEAWCREVRRARLLVR